MPEMTSVRWAFEGHARASSISTADVSNAATVRRCSAFSAGRGLRRPDPARWGPSSTARGVTVSRARGGSVWESEKSAEKQNSVNPFCCFSSCEWSSVSASRWEDTSVSGLCARAFISRGVLLWVPSGSAPGLFGPFFRGDSSQCALTLSSTIKARSHAARRTLCEAETGAMFCRNQTTRATVARGSALEMEIRRGKFRRSVFLGTSQVDQL